jgi:hypothetical protein
MDIDTHPFIHGVLEKKKKWRGQNIYELAMLLHTPLPLQ